MTWRTLAVRSLVTGTDTGVGKTIVTAAIAAAATAAGLRVAVVKPAQTGTADGAGPTSPTVLTDWPGPATAARPWPATPTRWRPWPRRGSPGAGAELYAVVDAVRAARGKDHDLVLVEGAGGLLVPMGAALRRGLDGGRPGGVARRAGGGGGPAPGWARSTTPRSRWRRWTAGRCRPAW